jgi:hypothetical protein
VAPAPAGMMLRGTLHRTLSCTAGTKKQYLCISQRNYDNGQTENGINQTLKQSIKLRCHFSQCHLLIASECNLYSERFLPTQQTFGLTNPYTFSNKWQTTAKT